MVFLSYNDKGQKNLGLTNKSVTSFPSADLIFTSKKSIVSFEYSAANFIIG